MKLENQVCTLEQAKRLKELGVVQTSLYCFNQFSYMDEWKGDPQKGEWELSQRKSYQGALKSSYSAFTVAELGVMLPNKFISHGLSEAVIKVRKGNRYWMIEMNYDIECDVCYECSSKYHDFTLSKTEAEACAAMLIYLLENNLITAEEVNKRLQQ